MKNHETFGVRSSAVTGVAFILLSMFAVSMRGLAQESTPATPQSGDAALHDLVSQMRELRAAVEQMRNENAQSRAEVHELRQELEETRKLLLPLVASTNAGSSSSAAAESTLQTANAETAPASPSDMGSRIQKLEESNQLLASKIDEQYQTKVETAAKYRARLSGIVLMNAFHNVGGSDNLDLPNYAAIRRPRQQSSQFWRHTAAN